jgi:hypothetical protein
MGRIRRATGKQELEASAAGGAEFECAMLAPMAWPRRGIGDEPAAEWLRCGGALHTMPVSGA